MSKNKKKKKKPALPTTGVLIYTSRSGQMYPSYFDDNNDCYFADSVGYLLNVLGHYITLEEWYDLDEEYEGMDEWDHEYFTKLNNFLLEHDQGQISIIQNEPSYEKYKDYL